MIEGDQAVVSLPIVEEQQICESVDLWIQAGSSLQMLLGFSIGMRGTPGYMAPEWLMEAGVSSMSDVYSLGIVLLEIVFEHRCMDLSAPAKDCYLPVATFQRV